MFSLKLYRHKDNPDPNTTTFHGGAWIGQVQATWPFGRLEVGPDKIIISIEETPFINLKSERQFTRDNLQKVEIKKYFPVIAYAVRITPRDQTKEKSLYFWYSSFGFKKLTDTLRKYNWIS